MSRIRALLLMSVSALIIVMLSGAVSPAATPSNTELTGVVKSSSGKPMEGVAVSARANNKTYTTTVYSDQNGEYDFPPLDSGHYKVWAQAVGFEPGRSELEILSGKREQRDFTLKTLPDFHRQLSGTEWLESLPNDTPGDRRQVEIINHNCTNCHAVNFMLQNRFDAAGWGKMVNLMEKITMPGYLPENGAPANPVLYTLVQEYKEEMVAYLTKVRGPESYPLKYKPFPRPSGEATQIVVTEFDIPRADHPDFISEHNGSNWSEGTPAKFFGYNVHDTALDREGNAWFSDDVTPERTIGKLDPKTGKVTNYKLPEEDNSAARSHGIALDPNGNVWFTNESEGSLTKTDPKTEQFTRFPRPKPSPPARITLASDSKGNIWAVNEDGAYKLEPETGKYTAYKSPSKGGGTYGIAVDAKDNAWYTQLHIDRNVVVDSRTGKVSDVTLSPEETDIMTDKDRQISARKIGTNSATPLDHKGPRRLAADQRGDSVWVAEYWGGRLAKIDINTKKVTEYSVPHPLSHPYAVAVDKNHMVWVSMTNSDTIVKFNPYTERFTEYHLPTLGTEIRWVAIDDRTDVPTVWLPYNRASKLARVQFRSASGTTP